MSTADKPRSALARAYARYANEYCRGLPLEHFMEAIPQAKQREITLASLALVTARRPDVHVFNELLVQYPRPGQQRPGQVVPDNLVVISDEPIRALGSYDTPFESARPFWALEYISPHSERKDYEESFIKYERDLAVPYCLFFNPENQELRLYRHNGQRYVAVRRNKQGRLPVARLEIEVAILDGWVRFWYQGELLPLPADLQRDLDKARREVESALQKAEHERRARLAAEREVERLRIRLAELEGGRGGPLS